MGSIGKKSLLGQGENSISIWSKKMNLGWSRCYHYSYYYYKPAHKIQIGRTNRGRTCEPGANHCIFSWKTF